jgi:hypothetical protein
MVLVYSDPRVKESALRAKTPLSVSSEENRLQLIIILALRCVEFEANYVS